jgi:CheY-like chemotaxis protein
MFRVLVVDDNPGDVDLLLECLNPIGAHATVARNGLEALELLRRSDSLLFDIVLLDVHLPGINGHEVLQEIRSDNRLRVMPVVVLSHSDQRCDVATMYRLGANCYIRKPDSLGALRKAVYQIEEFWLGLVALPSRH